MKTRYKIIIIISLSFIPISLLFPQVFLIFHLDKYETSEKCDTLNGTWDWFSDQCVEIKYKRNDYKKMCVDVGGRESYDERCRDESKWNMWSIIFPRTCFSNFTYTCKFIEEPEIWHSSDEKEIQPILDYCEAKERALGEGKNLRLPGGDLTYINNTHRIDSTVCSWIKMPNITVEAENEN